MSHDGEQLLAASETELAAMAPYEWLDQPGAPEVETYLELRRELREWTENHRAARETWPPATFDDWFESLKETSNARYGICTNLEIELETKIQAVQVRCAAEQAEVDRLQSVLEQIDALVQAGEDKAFVGRLVHKIHSLREAISDPGPDTLFKVVAYVTDDGSNDDLIHRTILAANAVGAEVLLAQHGFGGIEQLQAAIQGLLARIHDLGLQMRWLVDRLERTRQIKDVPYY